MLTIHNLQKSEKVIFKSLPAFLKNGHFKMSHFQNLKILFIEIFMYTKNCKIKNLENGCFYTLEHL